MKSGKWFICLFAAMMLGTGANAADEDRIGQGIYISDMDMSGMTYAEAKAAVDQRIEQIRSDRITVQVGEDSVEAIASDLGLHWENPDVVDDAFSFGNSGNAIKRYKDKKDLAQGAQMLPLQFSANENAVRAFIQDKCMQYEKKAQEASVSADGNGGINVVEGVTGQVINVDESVKAVQDFIGGEWQGGSATIALAVELDKPRATKEDLESIQDCLGTYTTAYGSTAGRNINVERGAELINDHIVYPGDTFSVCEHLVPFTAENGYELAPEYLSGTVGEGYGGGICQVSTTLYNALLRAELEIVERHNHTMLVTYVPDSMDAAIAEGAMDLVFRNNLDTPVLISGYAYGGELTFSVWGKETRPADRYIDFYSVVTSETPSAGTMLYAAPDQPVGYFKQVDVPMAGKTAECHKTVTYNGETTDEVINTSVYQATPDRWEVGTLGATNALLTAISANDLAAAQAAAQGAATEKESEKTTETDANGVVIDPNQQTPQTDPQQMIDPPEPEIPDPSSPDVYYDPAGGAYIGDSPDDVVIME